jgi:hypothetical protein
MGIVVCLLSIMILDAECHVFIVMLSVLKLSFSIIMLSVVYAERHVFIVVLCVLMLSLEACVHVPSIKRFIL